MKNASIIENRLKKNKKKLKSFLKREEVTCYRLYEKDIPEYPYIVDIYEKHAVVYEKGKKLIDEENDLRGLHCDHIKEAIQNIYQFSESHIILKTREKKSGSTQYEKLATRSGQEIVTESNLKFYVNFHDYLDTGLFLDHRPLRSWVKDSSLDKKVLNLFSYTGSISVYAAIGGAEVTTVDLSNTYINWALENFILNDIDHTKHKFIVSDVFKYLKDTENTFDTIIIDPPSFSNSKKIDSIFDVQRDHRGLLDLAALRLKKGGDIYFSNNFRKFKLDDEIFKKFEVVDLSLKSIPEDFRNKKIHQCYRLKVKSI